MRRSLTRFLPALFCIFVSSLRVDASTVASAGDASISYDGSGKWTISAGGATLELAIDTGRDFAVNALTSPSGARWLTTPGPDTFVRVGTETLPFGKRDAGFALQGVTTDTTDRGVRLNAAFLIA